MGAEHAEGPAIQATPIDVGGGWARVRRAARFLERHRVSRSRSSS
jgi:hypothetical protein